MLKEIHYILAIKEYGSMAKAAEHLYITQPALSRYIQGLENSIQTPLFIRNGSKLKLTFAGERYIEASQKMDEIYTQLYQQIHDVNHGSSGRIQIGISMFRSPLILPQIISEFSRLHPNIEIILHEHSAPTLEKMLARNEADIIIVNLPITTPGITYTEILEEPLLLVAPSNHPFCKKGIPHSDPNYHWIDINYFANDSFVLLTRNFKTRELVNHLLQSISFHPHKLLETGNINTAYLLAAYGFGVSILPESLIKDISCPTPPKLFRIGEPEMKLKLAVATKKDTYQIKAVEVFKEMLLKSLCSS